MSPAIGEKLRIRAMIYVAGEPVPFFWPMRNFIHHNPLHGFERLPFEEAVANGERLFHARGFLPRAAYRRYFDSGQVDPGALERGVRQFVKEQPAFVPFDLSGWLLADLTQRDRPVVENLTIADADDVHAVLTGAEPPERPEVDPEVLAEQLAETVLRRRPLYEVVDGLYGTTIGTELDEQVVRACLDFFDEGQSVWEMPSRERGFFNAWLDLAGRGVRLTFD
ncbi:MAG: Na-translocating system protein MpsB, partial [Chromatiaceae bacterium]